MNKNDLMAALAELIASSPDTAQATLTSMNLDAAEIMQEAGAKAEARKAKLQRDAETARHAEALAKVGKLAEAKSLTFGGNKASALDLSVLEREYTELASQAHALAQTWLAEAEAKYKLPNLSIKATKQDDGKYTATVSIKGKRRGGGGNGRADRLVIMQGDKDLTGVELYELVTGGVTHKSTGSTNSASKDAAIWARANPGAFDWASIKVSSNRGSDEARADLVSVGAQVLEYTSD